MKADLKSKPQKFKLAEKHLLKYLEELKRHFGFSDFQIIKLLEKSSATIKRTKKGKNVSPFVNFFFKI